MNLDAMRPGEFRGQLIERDPTLAGNPGLDPAITQPARPGRRRCPAGEATAIQFRAEA